MKKNQAAAIARLKTLYEKRGEDRVFARTLTTPPSSLSESIERKASRILPGVFPSVDQVFPLWEERLSFYDALEDDWLPTLYPRQYDQGLFGTLFGAEMEVAPVDGEGWASSNSRPLEGKSYDVLLQLAAQPRREWVERMKQDLRDLSQRSAGRWGVAPIISVDALNLCMQVRGNQTLLDIYDRPDELKAFLEAGVALNIEVMACQQAAIDMEYAGGVYDFFNAGWMPARSIPMSVDCYNFCNADVYAEFGLPYQQKLIDHFGGGNFHLHGNGRRLLPLLARLEGCIATTVSNDGHPVPAMDNLAEIKRQAGHVTPVVGCNRPEFEQRLRDHTLTGGVYYMVGAFDTIDAANRLMECVRSYRTEPLETH